MSYVEKADPRLQEYARKHKGFKEAYETDQVFRELCDIVTNASQDELERIIKLIRIYGTNKK